MGEPTPEDIPDPHGLPDDGWLLRWLSGDGPAREAAYRRELRERRRRQSRHARQAARVREELARKIAAETEAGYRCSHGLPKILGECLVCGGKNYGGRQDGDTEPPF